MKKITHKKSPKFNRTLNRFFPKTGKKCGAFLCRFFFTFSLAFLLLTLVLRFVPIPYSAYMVQQKLGYLVDGNFNYKIKKEWVSLDNISPHIQLAVIAAEDQRFPIHNGFDWNAIKLAFSHNQNSDKIRGASTISQQTAKNLYLWHGQNWLRKGLEVPVTFSLELLWSKKRILEVYLNIAEFGNGIFGIQAASQFYFNKSAKDLTQQESALLAAVLPNPISYNAQKPGFYTKKKQAWIIRQMNTLGLGYLDNL